MSVASAIGQVTTVISFVVFAAVVWFAYGKGRAGRFERAARAPFDLPDEPAHAQATDASQDAAGGAKERQ
jgi:cbb3-type cytochrome oxidase subunit 3